MHALRLYLCIAMSLAGWLWHSNARNNKSIVTFMIRTIFLQPPSPATKGTGETAHTHTHTNTTIFLSTNVVHYVGLDSRPNWRDHHRRMNLSLRGCWTLVVPTEIFIRNVSPLKGSDTARGKRRRKTKRERWREGRSGACGDVIRGSEILSEQWTSLHCELLVAWPETISGRL